MYEKSLNLSYLQSWFNPLFPFKTFQRKYFCIWLWRSGLWRFEDESFKLDKWKFDSVLETTAVTDLLLLMGYPSDTEKLASYQDGNGTLSYFCRCGVGWGCTIPQCRPVPVQGSVCSPHSGPPQLPSAGPGWDVGCLPFIASFYIQYQMYGSLK